MNGDQIFGPSGAKCLALAKTDQDNLNGPKGSKYLVYHYFKISKLFGGASCSPSPMDHDIKCNPDAPINLFPLSRKEHNNWTQPEDPNQVYHMLMKNFKRVYEGDLDFDGELVEGNR